MWMAPITSATAIEPWPVLSFVSSFVAAVDMDPRNDVTDCYVWPKEEEEEEGTTERARGRRMEGWREKRFLADAHSYLPPSLAIVLLPACLQRYSSSHPQGFNDEDLENSPGCWAATTATY